MRGLTRPARPSLLIGVLVAALSGCWSKPPDGAFSCDVDDDCPSGSRCLQRPKDGKLACYEVATSPSIPPDAGDACSPGSDGCAKEPPAQDDGSVTPPEVTADASADAQIDAGMTPDCGTRPADVEDAKCGDCNVGVKRRQRAWSTATCSYGPWGDFGPCDEKAECKPGAVQTGMKEPCGWCNKGSRTPTRTCNPETCKWGAFSTPPCTHGEGICQPYNLGGKGFKCCGKNEWMWCYDQGPANGCTWTGRCAECEQGSNCGC